METPDLLYRLRIGGDVGLDHGRLHEAGAEGVAMDPVLCIVDSDGLGQPYHSMLGCHVAGCLREAHSTQHRCGVDDPASGFVTSAVGRVRVLFEELLQGVFAAEEDATDVDLVRSVQQFHVSLVEAVCQIPIVCLCSDASVVHLKLA